MTSIDSPIVPIYAPHHFEANELNFINGTYVYTYNTDWQDYSDWPFPTEKPTTCCMTYMTSKNPLDSCSWEYRHNYLKNPGEYGFDFSNNHTHLEKYRGKWYIFYHTMSLQHSYNTDGGFRNICVDEIKVDEKNLDIHMGNQTLKGVEQIQPMNPFTIQQASTVAATQKIRFVRGEEPGEMLAATVSGETGILCVRGVKFGKAPSALQVKACGQGTIEVRRSTPEGELLASVNINNTEMQVLECKPSAKIKGTADLFFILKGKQIEFKYWTFK